MFKLDKGSLSMDNHDLDHIKSWIDEEDYTPKKALQIELECAGINIKKVNSIELNGSQMANKKYCDVYSKIICDFWNNN